MHYYFMPALFQVLGAPLWETVGNGQFFIYYDTYSTVILIASMHSIVII